MSDPSLKFNNIQCETLAERHLMEKVFNLERDNDELERKLKIAEDLIKKQNLTEQYEKWIFE